MIALMLAASLSLSDHATDHSAHHHGPAMQQAVSSTTYGDVRTVDAEARTALIRHGDLPELGMPGMVMEFRVAETVDIALFEPGAALEITVINGEHGLEVIAAEPEEG